MPRRPAAPRGGSALASDGAPLDLAVALAALSAGRPLRVTLGPGSGLPPDMTGTVVRVDDPTAARECVVVRVGGDDLPFAPEEVRLAGPRRRAGLRLPPAPEQEVLPAPGPAGSLPPSAAELAAAAAYASAPALSAVPDPASASAAPPPTAAGPPAAGGAGEPPRPPRRPQRRAAPRLEIVLRHGEEGWTVSAATGARTLLRTQPVEPAAALALTQALEVPAVAALVGEIVEAGRQQAALRVEALVAQLAAAEAELQTYGAGQRP